MTRIYKNVITYWKFFLFSVSASSLPNGKHLTKLSQKQRKKLATEEVVPAPSQPSAGTRGWGHRENDVPGSSPSLSLADIMQEQLQKSKLNTPTASKPINIKRFAFCPPAILYSSLSQNDKHQFHSFTDLQLGE